MRRLVWLRYLESIEVSGTPKKHLRGNMYGVRRKGRPTKRWIQEMKNLKATGVRNRKNKAKSRGNYVRAGSF